MEFGLKGKIALVTGSTAGIGLASALSLAKEGAHVYVNGRKKERVDAAVGEIKTALPAANVSSLVADLASEEGFKILAKELPNVDILINNMGIYGVRDFADIPDEEWMRFFEINVLSGVRASRLYLAGMKAKNWGRIIFISSESAINVPTEMIHYGMTKTCQLTLTQGLAQVCKGSNVTVNAILPGPTYTEGVEQFMQEVAEKESISIEEAKRNFFKSVRPSSLIQRFATAEEVGDLVTFIASDKAAAITGASIRIDGGIVRSII